MGTMRKASLMSDFVIKAPSPKNCINKTILYNVSYWTFEFSLGINELTELPSGKDKSWIILNFPGSDFGTMSSGDEMKSGNGGLSQGPAIHWDCIPFLMCSSMISGWSCVDLWFLGDGLIGDPTHPNLKPKVNPLTRYWDFSSLLIHFEGVKVLLVLEGVRDWVAFVLSRDVHFDRGCLL